MEPILTAAAFMATLGLTLAGILVVANKRLYVFEDPRIDQVEELLPRANCGACGSAGCRQFAETLIRGDTVPSACTVNAGTMNQAIADFLGVAVGSAVRRVARLACAGGRHVAYIRASYQKGVKSCRGAVLVSGGGKGCAWGCLGFGDCEAACEFDAIRLDRYGLPVVDPAKCTACGDCVEICPKNLFSLQPVTHRLWVACLNREPGDKAQHQCQVVCTACGRCVQDSPEGLIEIKDHLAVIDYSKNELASHVAIERCPTGAILWLEMDGSAIKGRDAKKVIRKENLPVA